MSRDQHSTGDGTIDISEERARAIDDAGRRAGAALRSPAPAHGAATIHRRAQRRRAVRVAAVASGVAVLIVAGVVVVSAGDRSGEQQPVDTVTSRTTSPATTNPATTPSSSPAATAPPPSTSVEPAETGAIITETQLVVERLLDAVNSAVIDDADDLTSIRRLFTEDATILEGNLGEHDPLPLERWILQLRAWGFDGALRSECLPDEESAAKAYCGLRARWITLHVEADEAWWVEVVDEEIHTLLIDRSTDRSEATLPLSVAELEDWEQWLRETDPETAARLVPSVGFADHPGVSRYDPALAVEMNASIQQYIDNRPPGDDISVAPDIVTVGDRLIVVTMARAGGHSYVLAARPTTGRDLETGVAEHAVLAAFDDAGRELWRTDLGGCPTAIAVVGDVIWVGSANCSESRGADRKNLTRIDASDGAVLGKFPVDETGYMVSAFGSLWVSVGGGRLLRVDPDLSTTVVGPFPALGGCDYCNDFTAGSGAMWVPLGSGGVAVIDSVTNQVTIISRDDIGHDALKVAIDGEVAYIASLSRVASVVDGKVRATASLGVGVEIAYLGPIDGVVGAHLVGGQFVVLRADDPMVVERLQTPPTGLTEIDGEAWTHVSNGEMEGLGRVELP